MLRSTPGSVDMGIATKTVYVLCGLPYAGKTTLAKRLFPEAFLIERDAFLEEINRDIEIQRCLEERAKQINRPISNLSDSDWKNALNDAISEEYCKRVTQTIQSSSATTIVVDGTHLQPLSRAFVRTIPLAKTIAIVLASDPEVCIQRYAQDQRVGVRQTITPKLIKRMVKVFCVPTLEEGFSEVRYL